MPRLPALLLIAGLMAGCSSSQPGAPDAAAATGNAPADAQLGSAQWYAWVDRSQGIAEDGHGPDRGSPEWNRAVQRKLGQEAPQATPGSPEWQQAVDALLRTRARPH